MDISNTSLVKSVMNNVRAHSDFAHVRATDSRVQSLSRDYPNNWNTYVFESKCSGGLVVNGTTGYVF